MGHTLSLTTPLGSATLCLPCLEDSPALPESICASCSPGLSGLRCPPSTQSSPAQGAMLLSGTVLGEGSRGRSQCSVEVGDGPFATVGLVWPPFLLGMLGQSCIPTGPSHPSPGLWAIPSPPTPHWGWPLYLHWAPTARRSWDFLGLPRPGQIRERGRAPACVPWQLPGQGPFPTPLAGTLAVTCGAARTRCCSVSLKFWGDRGGLPGKSDFAGGMLLIYLGPPAPSLCPPEAPSPPDGILSPFLRLQAQD